MDVGRLQGRRRYDYMEVIGRVEPGAETERTSGTRSRGRTMSGRLYGSTTARMQKVERLRRQSRGGTTPRMGEIELRLEQQSRANHDYRDIEGRVTPGAVTEETEPNGDRERRTTKRI